MTLELFIGVALILMLAAFVKGVSGFGSSLIAIPLIAAFFLVPQETRALVVTINLCLNVFMLVKARSFNIEAFKTFLPLILSVVVASLVSGLFLGRFDGGYFTALLSVLLILTAINKLLAKSWVIRHAERYFIPVGLLSGALNTLLGAGSVPVLIYLGNSDLKKEDFRITIVLFLFVLNSSSLVSFTLNQQYPLWILWFSVALLPFVLVGNIFGMKMQGFIPQRTFDVLISLFLIVMGLNGVFGLF